MITATDGTLRRTGREGKVRYAVIGLGWIAQIAVLPAFANASRNSQHVALVSGDERKLKKLGRKYKVGSLYTYTDFDDCLGNEEIDAVYIALPNDMHCEYAVRAAEAGVHVLCEKPLAITERECLDMIEAARAHGVKLMTAYRLHYELANTQAVELVRSGRLGDVQLFHSTFSMKVNDEENIRLKPERGGGTAARSTSRSPAALASSATVSRSGSRLSMSACTERNCTGRRAATASPLRAIHGNDTGLRHGTSHAPDPATIH